MRAEFASKAPTVVSIWPSAILTGGAVTPRTPRVNVPAVGCAVAKAYAPGGGVWYIPAVHDDLERRKSQHLYLVQRPEVEPEGTETLLSCVRLVHRAAPELSLDGVDLTAQLCGKTLRAPVMIAGMTGGTERAAKINRDLAAIAQ